MIQAEIPALSDTIPIDEGGQKWVYKATHSSYGDVVVKIIINLGDMARVEREVEIALRCTLPNVPTLFESGPFIYNSTQTMYFLEQFIEGITLREHLEANPSGLPLEQCLKIVSSLLMTAVELEKLGLVHRDIKPGNIIIDLHGEVWLLDFGIARDLNQEPITETAATYGPHTAGYAAPEQFRNLKKEVDIKADLFAIGVVAYEAFTGANPFKRGAKSAIEVLYRTEMETQKSLIIKGDSLSQLSGFIDILMSKYPSRRPPSAETAYAWYIALLPTIKLVTS
jgi:serine/threonine-protein kinase